MTGGEGKVGFASERIFGNISSRDASVAVAGSNSQIPTCPKCGDKTQTVWRAGTYKSLLGDVVQRWLCCQCGLRFSDPTDAALAKERVQQEFSFGANTLKNGVALSVSRQICDKEAKNLVAEQQQTTRVLQKETLDINTLLAKYEWYLQKEGYRTSTIVSRTNLLKILWRRCADFNDPESVKTLIAKQAWCEGRKGNAVDAYSSYIAMEGRTWNRPIYNGIAKIPFVPKETEIDQLIAGCTPRVATFLQLLKETHARPGEIWHCTEDDFDFETNTITITPEKGSNPRIFNMSQKLLGMLHNLPKDYGKYIFATPEMKLDYFRTSYEKQRNRLAVKLNNPRIKKIMFKTLRTWGGTYDYHKTKDPLYVMKRLGHKNLKNTLIYIQLEEALFKDEVDYVSKVAKTEAEACILIEAGFDFVCDFDGHKLFRKKKY